MLNQKTDKFLSEIIVVEYEQLKKHTPGIAGSFLTIFQTKKRKLPFSFTAKYLF